MDLSKKTTDKSSSTNHIFLAKNLFWKDYAVFWHWKADTENETFAIFLGTVKKFE